MESFLSSTIRKRPSAVVESERELTLRTNGAESSGFPEQNSHASFAQRRPPESRIHPAAASLTLSALDLAYTSVELIARWPNAAWTSKTSPVRSYRPRANAWWLLCGLNRPRIPARRSHSSKRRWTCRGVAAARSDLSQLQVLLRTALR